MRQDDVSPSQLIEHYHAAAIMLFTLHKFSKERMKPMTHDEYQQNLHKFSQRSFPKTEHKLVKLERTLAKQNSSQVYPLALRNTTATE